MEAANFEESNHFMVPPEGMTEKEVQTIYAYKGPTNDGTPVVVTCWKPTREEMNEIERTGRLWLYCMGESMPPVLLTAKSPFEEESDGW